ncbi:MAG TPA: LysM peptidoglycan-binding domain-containing protein [Longimicrobiales bacterium]|nr:LysM peptidoglycan-binding domain-containing protein [Longimicrobiales bacterium]
MTTQRNTTRLLVGAGLVLASVTTAWTVTQHSERPEPPPMEGLLESEAAEEVREVVWDLPATRNSAVDVWINFLAGRNAERTKLWLERQGRYGPMIRAELRERGMPEDLLYLALIESGLNSRAYSKAAASGMWQFIAETGQRYGLEVNSEVDDRRDPLKATTAALDYLTYLHNRFDSWYLAAAAYNTGENRVGRIMRETFGTEKGTDDDFWTIAHRLPRETRDYVPLMLAAGHIAKSPEEFGFHDLEYQDELVYDMVWVPGATELSMIARAAGVDADAVIDLNLQLMQRRTPANRAYPVRIPAGTRVAFEAAFPELYRTARLAPERPLQAGLAPSSARATESAAARTHRVARGETMDGIARRYGVSVSALRSANSGVNPRRMSIGQTLRIPGAASATAAAAPRVHQVRRGENLSVIARRYGVSVRQIQAWNGLRNSRILAGQRLKVSA